MRYSKTISIVALSVIITLALVSISGYELEVIADESSDKKYLFTNDVEITGEFSFANGPTELIIFEVFNQDSGFKRSTEQATFHLEKEINEKSPLLYEAADKQWKYADVAGMDYMTEFDVKILLAKNGEVFRQFNYQKCVVDNYEVETLFDKEEAWFGKGFAPIDKFDIGCEGYYPENPIYKNMTPKIESKQTSTIDLIEADKARKEIIGQ